MQIGGLFVQKLQTLLLTLISWIVSVTWDWGWEQVALKKAEAYLFFQLADKWDWLEMLPRLTGTLVLIPLGLFYLYKEKSAEE